MGRARGFLGVHKLYTIYAPPVHRAVHSGSKQDQRLKPTSEPAKHLPLQSVATLQLAAGVAEIESFATIAGDVLSLPSAQVSFVQDARGMAFRLEQLAGRRFMHGADKSCTSAQTGAVFYITETHRPG